MHFCMVFCSMVSMFLSLEVMPMSGVRMMCCFLGFARFDVLCCLLMMLGCLFGMFGSMFVMICVLF